MYSGADHSASNAVCLSPCLETLNIPAVTRPLPVLQLSNTLG